MERAQDRKMEPRSIRRPRSFFLQRAGEKYIQV